MAIPINNIASFDIDAQNCFTPVCPNELPVQDGEKIVDELNRQAKYATYRLGSKDAHSPAAKWIATAEAPIFSPIKDENIDMRWPLHAVPGTQGFELIQGLPAVKDYNFFVWKGIELDMHPYGACYHDLKGKLSTGAIEFLRAHHVQLVIVGGLTTEYCVKTTVLDLLKVGFQVIVNLAACRGVTPIHVETALQEMQAAGAVIVQSAAELPDVINKLVLL